MLYSFYDEQKERKNNEQSLRYVEYHTNETFSMARRETGLIELEGAAVCDGSYPDGSA